MSGPLDFEDDPREEKRRPIQRAPQAPPPARRPGAGRYTWFIGVAALLLIAVVGLNAIRTERVSSGGPEAGAKLPPFAVPLAEAELVGDANVALKAGEGAKRAACDVRGPDILNVCELAEQGPVVLALFPTEAGRCRSVARQLARMRERFPDVRFAAVGSRGNRRDLERLAAPFPVGWDRDGAVASIYGLVGCPQVTLARRGGEVVATTRTELTDDELAEQIEEAR